MAEEFAVVVKALWSSQYRSIAPRDLRDTVTKYVPEFRKHVGHHHDSQEFLLFLLDGLHEDLNEVSYPLINNTGWPRKNATPTITNFKEIRDKSKLVCALMSRTFKNDTKINDFDEGVLILEPFF